MSVIYASNYNQLDQLWSTCRTPNKGKPLGNKWYRIMKRPEDDVIELYYGGWATDGRKALSPDAKVLEFFPDKTIMFTSPMGYWGHADYNTSNVLRHINCGVDLPANLIKNYDTPGWWVTDSQRDLHPLFPGFTFMKGRSIHTPKVPEIEQELSVELERLKAKAKAMIKPLRVYDKFGAFNERVKEVQRLRGPDRKKEIRVDFDDVDPDNAESVIKFIAARQGFGVYEQTGTGYISGGWGSAEGPKYDFQKIIPLLLRYGVYKSIAQKRLDKYVSWYTKG